VALAEEELAPSLQQMDPRSRKDNVLGFLIDLQIVAKAAEDKKIENTDDFRSARFTRKRLMMDSLLASEGKAATTDEAMKKVYEEAAKQITGEVEVHARHILVETEDEAKAVVEELKKGADFAELAKKKSKDPAPPMAATSASSPRTRWYRNSPPSLCAGARQDFRPREVAVRLARHQGRGKAQPQGADFEQVKGQIETYVTRKAQADYVAKLREAAKVDRMDKPAEPAAKPDAKPEAAKEPASRLSPRWRREEVSPPD
jgi:peptidyl-prolyl cis-trans isomerase C